MLGLAEYVAMSAELLKVAKGHQADITRKLDPEMAKMEAIKMARIHAGAYQDDFETLLKGSLTEVGENAAVYYEGKTGIELANRASFVKKLVETNWKERYYGATIAQRLLLNRNRLDRVTRQTASWGKDYKGLTQLLVDPVPYGSQFNIDKRLLLAQSVKIEQDTAKAFADGKLIRWSLSPRHKQECLCDDYARAIDKEVVNFIEQNSLKIDPKGLYTPSSLPRPPHPNCQCEFGIVTGESETRGPVKRAIDKVRSLIKRIRGK